MKMGTKSKRKHVWPCPLFYTVGERVLTKASCTRQPGCPVRKVKRTTLRNRADRMFSELIRQQGYCEGEEWGDGVACDTMLQCAHVIGRANYRLRWVPDNAFCLCRAHHVHYTHHPLDWFAMLQERYPQRFERLRELAREPWDRDYDKVIAFLTVALEGE